MKYLYKVICLKVIMYSSETNSRCGREIGSVYSLGIFVLSYRNCY